MIRIETQIALAARPAVVFAMSRRLPQGHVDDELELLTLRAILGDA
jgi:hypothetical protein